MSRIILRPRRAVLGLTLCAIAAACGSDSTKHNDADVKVGLGANASQQLPLGPNDVRITSSDNVVVLSVIGDTVRMQLSDSLRNAVASEVNDAAKEKGAIASAIAKSVATLTSTAMGFVVAVNANDVQNLRYEDGHLRFDVKGGKTKISTSGNSADKAVFTADDAQKFIDAVKARQGPINK